MKTILAIGKRFGGTTEWNIDFNAYLNKTAGRNGKPPAVNNNNTDTLARCEESVKRGSDTWNKK